MGRRVGDSLQGSLVMDENEKTTAAPAAPAAPKPKAKPERVRVILTGAGSMSIEGMTFRKGQPVEVSVSICERLVNTGLFVKA